VLEGDAYDDCPSIRTFSSINKIPRRPHRIVLQFEHGLFGHKILKAYRFTSD